MGEILASSEGDGTAQWGQYFHIHTQLFLQQTQNQQTQVMEKTAPNPYYYCLNNLMLSGRATEIQVVTEHGEHVS